MKVREVLTALHDFDKFRLPAASTSAIAIGESAELPLDFPTTILPRQYIP